MWCIRFCGVACLGTHNLSIAIVNNEKNTIGKTKWFKIHTCYLLFPICYSNLCWYMLLQTFDNISQQYHFIVIAAIDYFKLICEFKWQSNTKCVYSNGTCEKLKVWLRENMLYLVLTGFALVDFTSLKHKKKKFIDRSVKGSIVSRKTSLNLENCKTHLTRFDKQSGNIMLTSKWKDLIQMVLIIIQI